MFLSSAFIARKYAIDSTISIGIRGTPELSLPVFMSPMRSAPNSPEYEEDYHGVLEEEAWGDGQLL